jgi:uncharacterized membrane protein YhaH (DUF805 family)
MSYEALFANPTGRTSRANFAGALVPLLAAAALYFFLVKGRNGEWVLVTLLFPTMVLHARRLHDMGHSAWLLLLPGTPTLTALWLHMYRHSSAVQPVLTWAALLLAAGFVVWGLAGPGQSQANRFA